MNTDKTTLGRPFTSEQARILLNAAQFYETWREAERASRDRFKGSLTWKTVHGRQYLYRVDGHGNGTSLGPRSQETEAEYERFRRTKGDNNATRLHARERLEEIAAIARGLRVGRLANAAAEILVEADVRGLLDATLMVVGTNCMPAYEVLAGIQFASGLEETEDFDLAWAKDPVTTLAVTNTTSVSILGMLKAVDSTYVVNTERPFQARNRSAYAVELLLAPSRAMSYPSREPIRPSALPEQEWLLEGTPVDQIVLARNGRVARIVAPDPRWFALHKLWLAEKDSRPALKKIKDRAQGMLLLDVIAEYLPQYRLDDAFYGELPDALRLLLARWRATRNLA